MEPNTLIEVSRLVPYEDIEKLKVVCIGLPGVTKEGIESRTTLIGIFVYITTFFTSTKDALHFAYFVFRVFGTLYNEGFIKLGFRPETDYNPFLLRSTYPNVDYRLVILKFLCDLEERDYRIVSDAVCHDLKIAPDAVSTRWGLVERMFDEGIATYTRDGLNRVYWYFHCFNREQMFLEYCKRHCLEG